jgi:hypothetical protein
MESPRKRKREREGLTDPVQCAASLLESARTESVEQQLAEMRDALQSLLATVQKLTQEKATVT